jgi:hypothetical protein
MTEDILEGLMQTELNPHKNHMLNINLAIRRVTHIDLMERAARDLKKLLGMDHLQWDKDRPQEMDFSN